MGFYVVRNDGTGDATGYAYSSLGELTDVGLPSGDLVGYTYDPLGRRASRSVNGVVTHKYVWSGNSLLAVYDGNDSLTQWFDYADARMPVAMEVHNGGATQRFLLGYDQVGSLRSVADASAGVVVKSVVYDSFGNILSDSNPSFDLPFGFAGGLYDPATGLVKFGVRDYDPDIGRWLEREPLRLLAGPDEYSYCRSDPIGFRDTTGTAPINLKARSEEYSGQLDSILQKTPKFYELKEKYLELRDFSVGKDLSRVDEDTGGPQMYYWDEIEDIPQGTANNLMPGFAWADVLDGDIPLWWGAMVAAEIGFSGGTLGIGNKIKAAIGSWRDNACGYYLWARDHPEQAQAALRRYSDQVSAGAKAL